MTGVQFRSKSAYFLWEVAALLQRTILTGWLLLIPSELKLLRLMIALLLSLCFLIVLLVSQPYRRRSDFAMGASCQVLMVCMFLGGLIVRTYGDIALDPMGSPELAHRFIGLSSVDEAVVLMIIVAFAMVGLLVTSLGLDTYWHALQQRRQQKWSTCTVQTPPTPHTQRSAAGAGSHASGTARHIITRLAAPR